ncbi:hypothetical protein [Streptomyces sp. NPDC048665]|uniref:hypothetical protein n=2 Tax=unclassified Streptomyces TaxID=2593676 RepID=UPI0034168F22
MVGLHFWNRLERSHSEDASVTDSSRRESVIVSDNGRTISAVESWGSCENRPRIEAHESTHAVTLLLKRTWPLWGGRGDEVSCPHNAGEKISVRLDAPLGDRTLTDRFTGRPIPFRTTP